MIIVLFLCLLSFMAHEKYIIGICIGINRAPKVKELIGDAIVAIANQDFRKLLSIILAELVKIILCFIIDINAIEGQEN